MMAILSKIDIQPIEKRMNQLLGEITRCEVLANNGKKDANQAEYLQDLRDQIGDIIRLYSKLEGICK